MARCSAANVHSKVGTECITRGLCTATERDVCLQCWRVGASMVCRPPYQVNGEAITTTFPTVDYSCPAIFQFQLIIYFWQRRSRKPVLWRVCKTFDVTSKGSSQLSAERVFYKLPKMIFFYPYSYK